MDITNFYHVAAAYGSSTFNNGAYNSATSSTTSTDTTPTTTGTVAGTLTNTGFDLIAAATLACGIACSALLIRFWKRKATVTV